jgi:hypothetical protein
MLALVAGFLVLPDADAAYTTFSYQGQRLVYTPAVMGIIAGNEFSGFITFFGAIALATMVPQQTWRTVFALSGVASWRLALGVWIAYFGIFAGLLIAIWCGGIVRNATILSQGQGLLSGAAVFLSWTLGLGLVGAAYAALATTILSLRLVRRPILMVAGIFAAWIGFLILGIIPNTAIGDIVGTQYASQLILPDAAGDYSAGILVGHGDKPPLVTKALGGLWSAPRSGPFIMQHLALIGLMLAATLALAGPRLEVLPALRSARASTILSRTLNQRGLARFGLNGFIFKYLWQSSAMVAGGLLLTFGAQIWFFRSDSAAIPLGLSWGLYMLRWPGMCEVFERGCLRTLAESSPLGLPAVRIRLWAAIALQASLLALPFATCAAMNAQPGKLGWLVAQILIAATACVALVRFRGGSTLFSLIALLWWYMLISGNMPGAGG